MSDTLIIINEHAGGGQMADGFRRLEHPLRDMLGAFDVAFTDRRGHAIELTRQGLLAGKKLIVAGGGDGTLNECVNGFFDERFELVVPAGAAQLAVLPGGTGGDFRKTLRITSPEAALAALKARSTLLADVGIVTAKDGGGECKRAFINIASFGLSGRVDRAIPKFKQLGGKLGYMGATLESLWGWKNPRVKLTLDGDPLPPQPVTTVAVGNGRYFGGGMMICPDARLDSGVFDVTVLGDFGRLELMMQTGKIYSGDHVYHAKVKVRRAKVVEAHNDVGETQDVFLDIDGEAIGTLPARFEIRPGAIQLVVP